MSYVDVDTCASTQVAQNVFHMLRNNTTNMLCVERDGVEVLEQCDLLDVAPRATLAHIALLLGGDYKKTRIYDIEKSESIETRRVIIWVQSHPGYQTVCDIEVCRKNLDGEGWRRWKANEIRIEFVFEETITVDYEYTLKHYASRHGREELSRQVYENIGALLSVAT